MSQQQRSENARTLTFMVVLSVVCALVLSIVASVLSKPQAKAKELDRSQQMMIASKILSYDGYFLMKSEDDKLIPAKYTSGGVLVPGSDTDFATSSEILEVFDKRLVALLVNDKGELTTFKEAGVDENAYIADFQKTGYYKLPLMLIYKILPNAKEGESVDPMDTEAQGWVIPVNGFGLWDAIYGYLAIKPDGETVIGITWYEQKETPGLGANIATPEWQKEFPGKLIFLQNPDGETDFKTAPLGITVVKGKVSEVLGDTPKAKSAVDGMAGATLTGNGVTDAYKDSLAPYRPFLIKIHEQGSNSNGSN
ncbi:MAG: NADH:ubiquinone reductase (Na(+)-transporting) subunit C [Chlamydiota bacterium]|nr:NADH:ubiquinone reductase (Na(+)-transporting) subunit C [Chlamydiota bacterium]